MALFAARSAQLWHGTGCDTRSDRLEGEVFGPPVVVDRATREPARDGVVADGGDLCGWTFDYLDARLRISGAGSLRRPSGRGHVGRSACPSVLGLVGVDDPPLLQEPDASKLGVVPVVSVHRSPVSHDGVTGGSSATYPARYCTVWTQFGKDPGEG